MEIDPIKEIVEILHAIRQELGYLRVDIREIRTRQNEIGRTVAEIRRAQSNDPEISGHAHARIDRLNEEIERIKRRLDQTGTGNA